MITNQTTNSVQQKVKLVFIKGPLSLEQLQNIAQLYGKYESNYQSTAFCDHLFNKNPMGYSYHAFLIHLELGPVGHYSMIPIEIDGFGKKEISVKGEAFVVAESCRKMTIEFQGKATPVAFALSVGLTHYVMAQGIKLIHFMSPQNVARIHQRSGFKELKLTETSHYFFNTTLPSVGYKYLLKRGCALFQAGLYRGLSFIGKMHQAECLPIQELDDSLIKKIAEAIQPFEKNCCQKWSIPLTDEILHWYLTSSVTHLIKLKDQENLEEFALVRKHSSAGQPMEIFAWITTRRFSTVSLTLMACIIAESKKKQSPWIRFSNEYLFGHGLRRLSKLFGFISKKHETSLYVKACDPIFEDREKVCFHPGFYIIC